MENKKKNQLKSKIQSTDELSSSKDAVENSNFEFEVEHLYLSEPIRELKVFRFPFVSTFQPFEYDELISQAERIKSESISYINFLNFTKDKITKLSSEEEVLR